MATSKKKEEKQEGNDALKLLEENRKKMSSWVSGMNRRSDTKKKVKATIEIKKAADAAAVERIPTGRPAFDIITRGGLPCGRHCVFYAPPSAGKTSTMASAIRAAQERGIIPLYNVPEGFDGDWFEVQGVDLDNLYFSEEQECARILNAVDEAARGSSTPEEVNPTGPFTKLIIVDSVAAMKHSEEALKGAGGDNIALTARRMSQFFRSQNTGIVRNKPSVVWVNQIRDDTSDTSKYKLEKYPGGNALKFYSSLDVFVRRGGKSTLGDSRYNAIFKRGSTEIPGFPVVYKVRKTKLYGVPERSEAIGIFFEGIGFQREPELALFLAMSGIATMQGTSKYIFPVQDGNKIKNEEVNGFGSLIEYVSEHYDEVYTATAQRYMEKYEEDKNLRNGLRAEDSEEHVDEEDAPEVTNEQQEATK